MLNGKKVLALITARGGSKRLKRKNVRDMAGAPLIAWTVRAALQSAYVDRTILSSDDPEIIDAARDHGCEIPFRRPADLATDEASSMDVVFHALDAVAEPFDYLVLLQPTSPLRLAADIDACLDLCENENATACVSVTYLDKPAGVFGSIGEAGRFAFAPFVAGHPRPCYLNGAVYAVRTEALRRTRSFYDATTRAYPMPASRSVDIDEEEDFRMAEALLLARAGAATR